MELTNGIISIKNSALEDAIVHRLNDLTKPVGSLGRLEEFVLTYCLCRGRPDAALDTMRMFTFAADHGITAEKVAPYPKEVTRQMVLNMVNGGAAISVICKNACIDSKVVDMGVEGVFPKDCQGLVDRKVAQGTASFLRGPAMTAQQCEQALAAGAALATEFKADLFGAGEMGIGNSSSASALYSLVLDVPAEQTVGSGTGATGELLAHKKHVVADAVAFHRKEWDGS
jgi:nicotinate-nucleotide--dimethylbenzimidazole phosphoribosyltransferase